jgi:hypothetical protein
LEDTVPEYKPFALGKPIDTGNEPQEELVVGFDRRGDALGVISHRTGTGAKVAQRSSAAFPSKEPGCIAQSVLYRLTDPRPFDILLSRLMGKRRNPMLRCTSQSDGLNETGDVEGRNLAIQYRFADGQNDRLRAIFTELIRRQVLVIVLAGSPIPIVFHQR